MKALARKKCFNSLAGLMFLTTTLLFPARISANEYKEKAIAHWVADKFKVTQSFEMPIRHFVDKPTLSLAFKIGNKKSYFRWQEEYGKEKADEMLEEYLDQIVGLFNENTQIIYVGNFINPCNQEAIFAHEMVHYLQNLEEWLIPPDAYGENMNRLRREMQAYDIEEKYRAAFCKEDGESTFPIPKSKNLENKVLTQDSASE